MVYSSIFEKVWEGTINESSISSQDIRSGFESTFRSVFRNSYFSMGKVGTIYGDGYVSVRIEFLLARDKNECLHGIPNNDPMHTNFYLEIYLDVEPKMTNSSIPLEDLDLSNFMVLKRSLGDGLLVPNPDKGLAYNRKKVMFRQTKGDLRKVLASFKKYLLKVRSEVADNAEYFSSYPFDVRSKI